MISLRRFLYDGKQTAAASLREAAAELRRLLTVGVEARGRWGRDLATPEFELTVRELLRALEGVSSALELARVAAAILGALEEHTARAAGYFREQSRQMQSMMGMLTATVADISAQSDGSVSLLQELERKIEHAVSLEDMRSLKESLATCLAAVKEAAIHQKNATAATVERLQEHIKRAPQPPEAVPRRSPAENQGRQERTGADYVAAVRLQRAGHIQERFGRDAVEQMLAVVAAGLKTIQGPKDRIMRWKGPSLLLFLNSAENIAAIRHRLAAAAARISQGHIEVGAHAALLAVAVEWILLPQTQYPSLEVVFAEVDSFLDGKAAGEPRTNPMLKGNDRK